jgi:hypothetical protein
MQKIFLFPGLLHLGLEAGFSIPLTTEVQTTPDLTAIVTLFSGGCYASHHEISFGQLGSLFFRGWTEDWFSENIPKIGDELFCVSLISPSQKKTDLPKNDIEGQMVFKHKEGWISSILTGFVPARESGHRFAPIIHTAHYIASESEIETITLFMNIKDLNYSGPLEGGIMNAEVSTRNGKIISMFNFPIKGNSTIAISSDDLTTKFNLSQDLIAQGVNIKFWGGSSQFSILTVYRNRFNGSIGLEHSLRPLYYLPDLVKPSVRNYVYKQLQYI